MDERKWFVDICSEDCQNEGINQIINKLFVAIEVCFLHILFSESDYAGSVDLESLLTNNINDLFHVVFENASFLLLIIISPFFWRHLFDIFLSYTELSHQIMLLLTKQFFLCRLGHHFIGILISCYGLLLLSG